MSMVFTAPERLLDPLPTRSFFDEGNLHTSLGEMERGAQPSEAGTDDEDVYFGHSYLL